MPLRFVLSAVLELETFLCTTPREHQCRETGHLDALESRFQLTSRGAGLTNGKEDML